MRDASSGIKRGGFTNELDDDNDDSLDFSAASAVTTSLERRRAVFLVRVGVVINEATSVTMIRNKTPAVTALKRL